MTADYTALAEELDGLAKEITAGDWTRCIEEFGPECGAVYIFAHDVDADDEGLPREYGSRVCDMADDNDDMANAAFIAFCHRNRRTLTAALREAGKMRGALEAMLHRFELYCGEDLMHAGNHDRELVLLARAALGGPADA